ncbi:MAG: hypothetical protein JWN98_1440, partial [Abditibacteriota bacterium]|nr:hypothetical protein [Abditibacteriota bacterium]
MPGDTDNQRDTNEYSSNAHSTKRATSPQEMQEEPSYYDVPMLKAPVWTWEVAAYFFLGGLASGAYTLARLAERFGHDEHRDITRAGTVVASLAAAPCAPLLISDLGDPTRFHHMLRIFKPKSPMNLGTWVLTGFSAMLALGAAREVAQAQHERVPDELLTVADSAVSVGDAATLPLALLLSSYTGILLSGTANPVWCRNRWLGPLFVSSAMSSGAAAISLALEVLSDEETEAKAAMRKVETTARVAEAANIAGYLHSAGNLAKPLTHGEMAPYFLGGTIGGSLILPELLTRLPAGKKLQRWFNIIANISTLIGGLSLRWSVLKAGTISANDPAAARE